MGAKFFFSSLRTQMSRHETEGMHMRSGVDGWLRWLAPFGGAPRAWARRSPRGTNQYMRYLHMHRLRSLPVDGPECRATRPRAQICASKPPLQMRVTSKTTGALSGTLRIAANKASPTTS